MTPDGFSLSRQDLDHIASGIAPLRGAAPDTIRSALLGYWDELETRERFLLIKLIGDLCYTLLDPRIDFSARTA